MCHLFIIHFYVCVSIIDTGADKERVRDGINITVFYCKVIFDGERKGEND